MKKVWVIEKGEYSDYRVVGVFSTLEHAQQVLNEINKHPDDYYEATIAEWVLDPAVEEINAGRKMYRITMDTEGNTEEIEETCLSCSTIENHLHLWKRSDIPVYKGKNIKDAIIGCVWAKSQEHAIKITNEFRIKTLVEMLFQVDADK